jgi:hypothetical protein
VRGGWSAARTIAGARRPALPRAAWGRVKSRRPTAWIVDSLVRVSGERSATICMDWLVHSPCSHAHTGIRESGLVRITVAQRRAPIAFDSRRVRPRQAEAVGVGEGVGEGEGEGEGEVGWRGAPRTFSGSYPCTECPSSCETCPADVKVPWVATARRAATTGAYKGFFIGK